MVIRMGNSGETDAGGGDLRLFNPGLLTSLRYGLSDVDDGGFHPDADVICGFSAPFANDFATSVNYGRATIGSTSINTQPKMRLVNCTQSYSLTPYG